MDTERVLYTERLWPAWWLWTALVIAGAALSVIFFPIDVMYGVLAMIVGIALVVFALWITTPRLEITEAVLRVGRAQIERQYLGRVVAHTGDAATEQLGPGFDARSYQCIRGWIPTVVTAQITDPEDPTPYWIFSTRNPQAVLAALDSEEPVRTTGVSRL
ncbi:DUF3093 domain-containing protein [Nesterenkonia alba]|uniref:DUF3093 domain-containing protein n=1 Tax=Nesterenkonia alba TaxID=515814 RepID=UPI0003B44E4D|nr:DUF3093 domain-containing protein [Nesterenkonia alba]